MKALKQFLKGLGMMLWLLGVFYILFEHTSLSLQYGLPQFLIPAVALVSILYIGYIFIKLYVNIKDLDHEFTSVVNHTFRTPITSILWLTKELEKDMPDKERLQYLANINTLVNKILSIVDIFAGIKDITERSSYVFEATSLREIVEKSIVVHREEINKKGITFQVSTFKDIPLLTVDLKKISFVVDSLLENATLYTPKGGKIVVECITHKDHLAFYVSDTGIGLTFRDKMHIFSRFYRGKTAKLLNMEGMGLRLYLSRIIVKRHSGKIYAKSKGNGKGTTFIMELPFHK